MTGRVLSWNAAKRFGFIRPHDGAKDFFVHVRGLVDVTALQRGQTVEFRPVMDAPRGPRAVDVHVVLESMPTASGRPR